MSKTYVLFMPSIRSGLTRPGKPSKNSCTLAIGSTSPSSLTDGRSLPRAIGSARVDFDLSPEQELIRDTVRSFARERVAPVAAELDLEGRFPYELVKELAELGLMGLPIPEEHGGAGGDTVSYAIAIEELTRIDSSVAITVAAHTSLGTMPILMFGTDEQKERWLRTSRRAAGSRRSGSPSRARARTRGTRGRPRSSATARG